MSSFLDFENRHRGETIWVLGSGRTLDFVGPSFFADKTVVATNHTFLNRLETGYVVSNHWRLLPELAFPSEPFWFVTPEVEAVPESDRSWSRPDGSNVLFVPTIGQKFAQFKPLEDWPEHGRFVVGPTSLHLSLHWAVWLGAAHIVLVGADCGDIDGVNNAVEYYRQEEVGGIRNHAHHKLWERTLVEMAEKIRSLGVSVHSLNPWVTFNLEGHVWSQAK